MWIASEPNFWFFVSRALDGKTRPMDPLLKLLHNNAALKPSQLAGMLNLSEAEVVTKIKSLRKLTG